MLWTHEGEHVPFGLQVDLPPLNILSSEVEELRTGPQHIVQVIKFKYPDRGFLISKDLSDIFWS